MVRDFDVFVVMNNVVFDLPANICDRSLLQCIYLKNDPCLISIFSRDTLDAESAAQVLIPVFPRKPLTQSLLP